jgi:hypothetical protein
MEVTVCKARRNGSEEQKVSECGYCEANREGMKVTWPRVGKQETWGQM